MVQCGGREGRVQSDQLDDETLLVDANVGDRLVFTREFDSPPSPPGITFRAAQPTLTEDIRPVTDHLGCHF